MKDRAAYIIKIGVLCLSAFVASTAFAQSKKEIVPDSTLCSHVINALKTPDGTPTVVLGLDDRGTIISALFIDAKDPDTKKHCVKALPTKVSYPIEPKYPITHIERILPLVHIIYRGSQWHSICCDAYGNMIWYQHQH